MQNPKYGIYQSYASQQQDVFIAACLGGKIGGTYLEIGAGPPVWSNNTYLLETTLNWRGVSIDINPQHVNLFNIYRRNPCIIADATFLDYTELLNVCQLGPHIDYLQLDVDPPGVTLEVLKRIDFTKFQFSIITFEHDYYGHGPEIRNESRDIIKQHGYVLAVSDVIEGRKNDQSGEYHGPFEDWYVHPDYIGSDRWKRFEGAWVAMDPSTMNEKTKSTFSELLNGN